MKPPGSVIDASDAKPPSSSQAHILSGMVPEAKRLHAAFVSALPGYVTAVFAERGYPLDRSAVESIERATAVLDAELGSELERPFREQRRSPLEIVRRVLGIPGDALGDAGVVPTGTSWPLSDADPYDLAPGSSSVLGSEAPVAADPVVLVMADGRVDREELMSAVEMLGLRPQVARNPGAVASALDGGPVVFALVDLAHRSARDAIAQLVEASTPTIVYGDGIADLVETGLRAQGVREVVDRRRLLADPSAFLPLIA